MGGILREGGSLLFNTRFRSPQMQPLEDAAVYALAGVLQREYDIPPPEVILKLLLKSYNAVKLPEELLTSMIETGLVSAGLRIAERYDSVGNVSQKAMADCVNSVVTSLVEQLRLNNSHGYRELEIHNSKIVQTTCQLLDRKQLHEGVTIYLAAK